MNIRTSLVCSVLLLFASVASGAGSYQRTKDGKTLVWTDSTEPRQYATWSGKRDKKGFATGSGTLTWYKVKPTITTGSLIPDTRSGPVVAKRYSGRMVHGKLVGGGTRADSAGKRLLANVVDKVKSLLNQPPPHRPSRRTEVTRASASAARAASTAKKAPTPIPERTAAPTLERAPFAAAPATSPPPEKGASPAGEENATLVAQMATDPAPEEAAPPPPEQQARPPDARTEIGSDPTAPAHLRRSLPAPAPALPKPPPSQDVQTVAAFDTVYQKAVKANDVAIMDEILADDFVLVTERGTSLTKADLIKEARDKRTIYENHEEEEGTQKVRVWRDTAVVTARLRIKGTRDQSPFDYKVWLSQTYVRTPMGWRYVFGQAAMPFSAPDTK